jgi:hypothetical protein
VDPLSDPKIIQDPDSIGPGSTAQAVGKKLHRVKILQPKNYGGAFLVVGGGLYQGEDEDSGDGGDDGQGDPEGAVLVRLQTPPPLVGSADDSAIIFTVGDDLMDPRGIYHYPPHP